MKNKKKFSGNKFEEQKEGERERESSHKSFKLSSIMALLLSVRTQKAMFEVYKLHKRNHLIDTINPLSIDG